MGNTHISPRNNKPLAVCAVFLLFLLGTVWLKFATPIFIDNQWYINGVPFGTVVGIIIVAQHKNRNFRVAGIIALILGAAAAFFLPVGVPLG